MSAETIQITILYFTSLADDAGINDETLTIDKNTSLSTLYEMLRQKHKLSLPQSLLRVAINDYFASWDDAINDGDSIVFISPVAGG